MICATPKAAMDKNAGTGQECGGTRNAGTKGMREQTGVAPF